MSGLRRLRESKGLSQARLAALIGTSQPQIKRLESGDRELTKPWAERLAPHLGVTASELLFSSGELERIPEDADSRSGLSDLAYTPALAGASPELDVRAGAGEGAVGQTAIFSLPNGQTYTDHEVLAEWLFPQSFLRSELKARTGFTVVIEVQGDSMRPTLEPGDRVIVDLSQNRFGPDGAVYIIADLDGEPQVKRLQITEDEPPKVRISSDNPAARDRVIPIERLRIVGRVVGRVSRL